MAAVGSKTLYCRGECKSAILAYMAGIRREREGDFFFSPQYPLPFMHLPSKLHPMEGNPDSGMRKIFACGIRNPENFACGIRNPGLWSPEYSLRNPLTTKIQNPSSSDRDWNPVPGILKSVKAWNRESQTIMDSRDVGLQALGSRSLVQLSMIENFFKPRHGLFLNHFLRSHRYAMCLVISLRIQPSLLSRDVSLPRNVPCGEERARQSFVTQLKYSSLLRISLTRK